MKKVLIIQHVPHEGPGILGKEFNRIGVKAQFLRVFKGEKVPHDAGGYSGIIALGGPMGVYEEEKFPFIKDELKLLESALRRGLPVLGICLGSQMLAKAAGARVYKGGAKEIGWYTVKLTEEGKRDRLFMGMPEEVTVFQWHGDTFNLPKGGTLLASSGLFPSQAIRVGQAAYGLQFHFEVTEGMIRDWIRVNDEELEGVKDCINPVKIIGEMPGRIQTVNMYGDMVAKRFMRLITL